MGNYKELEYEFIERTLALIDQYEIDLKNYAFKEQYNYTLLINCLTGIIVMPKEKTIDVIPNDRLLSQMKIDMGLAKSTINSDFKTVKEFAISLRHCVAHFSIKIESETPEFLIDNIIFYDNEKGAGYEVANFAAEELLPFIKYYASWLLVNLQLKAKHVKRGTSRVRHN